MKKPVFENEIIKDFDKLCVVGLAGVDTTLVISKYVRQIRVNSLNENEFAIDFIKDMDDIFRTLLVHHGVSPTKNIRFFDGNGDFEVKNAALDALWFNNDHTYTAFFNTKCCYLYDGPKSEIKIDECVVVRIYDENCYDDGSVYE